MRQPRLWICPVIALVGAILAPLGCSSSSPCNCAAGNQCIDDGSGSGLTCHKVCDTQAQCPSGWYCHEGQVGGQPKSWCIPSWHTSCSPRDGEADNPACDKAHGFACYAQSPTDANAFCTVIGCKKDGDCPGGWWCATVNQAPNALTAKASLGSTRTVCLPRAYCAPCQSDGDCVAAPDSTPQRCVQNDQGDHFCTPECSGDDTCPLDATCLVQLTICSPATGSACKSDGDCPPAKGTYQHCDGGHCTPECAAATDCDPGQRCTKRGLCAPRAGVCKGDGSFCSPCRSDDDCATGLCATGAPYSTESFCTAKATVPSCSTASPNPAGCPAHRAGDNWKVTQCTQIPPNQCVAEVQFGFDNAGAPIYVPGCWTVNR